MGVCCVGFYVGWGVDEGDEGCGEEGKGNEAANQNNHIS